MQVNKQKVSFVLYHHLHTVNLFFITVFSTQQRIQVQHIIYSIIFVHILISDLAYKHPFAIFYIFLKGKKMDFGQAQI